MSRSLIVKDAKAKVRYLGTAIEVKSLYGDTVVGFRHIRYVYLHQDIDITIKTAIRIARKVPLFLIDKRGKIIARVSFDV